MNKSEINNLINIADKNKDGKLSREELEADLLSAGFNQKQITDLIDNYIAKIDTNSDGTVSVEEFKKYLLSFTFKLNNNVDCRIENGCLQICTFASIPFERFKFIEDGADCSIVNVFNAKGDVVADLIFDLHDEFLSLKEFATTNDLTQ